MKEDRYNVSKSFKAVKEIMKTTNEKIARKILTEENEIEQLLELKDTEIQESLLFKLHYYAVYTAENRSKMQNTVEDYMKKQELRRLKEACAKEIKARRSEKKKG